MAASGDGTDFLFLEGGVGHGVDGLMHALVITKLSSPSEDGISFCSYRKTEAANGPSDITLYLTPSQSSETCLFYKLILTNLFILPLSPMPTAQEPHTLNILTNTEFTVTDQTLLSSKQNHVSCREETRHYTGMLSRQAMVL